MPLLAILWFLNVVFPQYAACVESQGALWPTEPQAAAMCAAVIGATGAP